MRRVFHGGRIRTMDPGRPTVERVVVVDGRIEAIDAGSGVEPGPGRPGEVIDLEGRTLLPGFVDSHLHLSQLAREGAFLDLSGARTRAELAERLEEDHRARGDRDGWRRGCHLAGALPEEIRRSGRPLFPGATASGPVLLGTEDLHVALVNRPGIERLEADGVLEGIPGRCVERTVDGAVLRETAAFAAARAADRSAGPVGEAALSAAVARLHAHGVTGIFTFERPEDARAIARSASCARGLELGVALYGEDAGALRTMAASPRPDGVGVVGLKVFVDGALGSRTAWLLEPYEGEGGTGIEVTPRDRRREQARMAARAGVPLCVHAIGDAAVRAALDLLEEVRRIAPGLVARQRIEHVQLLHPDDLDRWERIGGLAALQPLHLLGDRDEAERAWGERCRRAYPQRLLLDRGIRLAFGSDAPAGECDPLEAIRVAVVRRNAAGESVEREWCLGERIGAGAAFAAHTRDAAFASGLGGTAGRIREGLHADLVVLSGDPLRSEADLMAAEVVATVSRGEVVWGGERLKKTVHP